MAAIECNLSKWILFGGFVMMTMMLQHGMAEKFVKKYDLPESAMPLEDSFTNIQKLDDQECIPRLLCEMAATSKKTPLSKEETSILDVFNNEKTLADRNGKSPLSIYKFAIEMGNSGSVDELRCQKHFSKCPLTGQDLLSAFKSIIVSKT